MQICNLNFIVIAVTFNTKYSLYYKCFTHFHKFLLAAYATSSVSSCQYNLVVHISFWLIIILVMFYIVYQLPKTIFTICGTRTLFAITTATLLALLVTIKKRSWSLRSIWCRCFHTYQTFLHRRNYVLL